MNLYELRTISKVKECQNCKERNALFPAKIYSFDEIEPCISGDLELFCKKCKRSYVISKKIRLISYAMIVTAFLSMLLFGYLCWDYYNGQMMIIPKISGWLFFEAPCLVLSLCWYLPMYVSWKELPDNELQQDAINQKPGCPARIFSCQNCKGTSLRLPQKIYRWNEVKSANSCTGLYCINCNRSYTMSEKQLAARNILWISTKFVGLLLLLAFLLFPSEPGNDGIWVCCMLSVIFLNCRRFVGMIVKMYLPWKIIQSRQS